MDKSYQHFYITQRPKAKGKKTHVYDIIKHDEAETRLGTIKWHGAWRQYCIFFEGETIFNLDCLDDVTDFLVELKEERKKKEKKRCVYGMGKGREATCAFSLSEFHGEKTNGDRKKKPCKDCEHYDEEDYRPMSKIMGDLKRGLRSLDRSSADVASKLTQVAGGNEEDEDEPRPFIPSFDDEED